MGKSSIFRLGMAAGLLALCHDLISCSSGNANHFASTPATPAAVSTPIAPGPATGATTAQLNPVSPLRPIVGEDARRFRQDVAHTMAVQKTDHFVFVARPDAAALPQVAHLLEQTHRTFYEVFAGMSDKLSPIRDPLVWLVFDGREDYEQYAQEADGVDMSWAKAYYSAQTNRVAIAIPAEAPAATSTDRSAAATGSNGAPAAPAIDGRLFAQITHEAGHQLAFNSGLQKRGVMYPLWASEGLAANFELDANGRLGPQARNTLRTRHVLTARAENRLVPLEQWVAFTRVPIGRPAQINAAYGQAWAFFRFLYEHRRDQLQDYLAHMARQQPGRRSEETLRSEFVRVFGEPEKLAASWDAYLKKLGETAEEE